MIGSGRGSPAWTRSSRAASLKAASRSSPAAEAGKTTLGLEFTYRGAHDFGEPGLIVTFEVSPERIVADAATLGWNLAELEQPVFADQLVRVLTGEGASATVEP